MSIYTVNSKHTITRKIELLNDMIEELEGLVEQGKFDKNEIAQIIIDCGINRKYIRNVNLGNTLTDYSDWTHVQSEDGYSIWKIAPTSYTYSSVNQMYFDNKIVDNQGEANTELATSFDKVYLFNGDSGSIYVDNTAEASTEGGTQFQVMNSTSDYLYLGDAAKFTGAKFEWQERGSNYTLVAEYWNGSAWTTMTANVDNLSDGTSDFESDGLISWDSPSTWATTAVNGVTKYWIRLSTSTTPVTVANAFFIIPGNSVVGLLALSATELQQETWKWCTYGSNVYVTIRNTGNSSYEGDYYVTSSSSTANKQNFFIYNHTYSLDHQDSTYEAITTVTTDTALTGSEGVVIIDLSVGSVTVTLPDAYGNTGKQIIIKATAMSGNTAIVDGQSSDTIDGLATYTFQSDNEAIRVISNGTNWYIIDGYKE